MLAKFDVQLIQGLRRTGTDSKKRNRVVQWSHGDVALFLNLGLEESDATGHFVYTTNLAYKRALKGVQFGVQLSQAR